MTSVTAAGPYGPLTKSIDIDEALMLIGLVRELPVVPDWRAEARIRLPQASLQRRQEIVASVQAKFLQIESDRFIETPLLRLLNSQLQPMRLKRDLLLGQYLRATPLVWEAIRDVVLPHAEAETRNRVSADPNEVVAAELDELLKRRLRRYTVATLSRTRNHITAHLTKFGLLEARAVPGDRIAKRFYAHFYEPDVGHSGSRWRWSSTAAAGPRDRWTT